jgi:hypothetical protein
VVSGSLEIELLYLLKKWGSRSCFSFSFSFSFVVFSGRACFSLSPPFSHVHSECGRFAFLLDRALTAE